MRGSGACRLHRRLHFSNLLRASSRLFTLPPCQTTINTSHRVALHLPILNKRTSMPVPTTRGALDHQHLKTRSCLTHSHNRMTVTVAHRDSTVRRDNMDTHSNLTTRAGAAGPHPEDIMEDLHREECTISSNRRWATIKIRAVDTVQALEGSAPGFWARWHAAAASKCYSSAVATRVTTIHSCTLPFTNGERKAWLALQGILFENDYSAV